MKILLINYSYPPALTPRAFRWGSVTRRWAEQGHEVDVICGSEGADPTAPAGVQVHAVGNARPLGWGASTAADGKVANTQGPRSAKVRFVTLARRIWRRVYWPDAAVLWLPAALRRARHLTDERSYDLLISSSHPFTGHLVGRAIKRRHPSLFWLVDVGDPFSFADGAPVNNFALYRNLNRRTEAEILALADAISVTTAGTSARYIEMFPKIAPKVAVIPPLLPDAFDSLGAGTVSDDRIRLVFVGTLYPDIRSPAPLLACFDRLLGTSLGNRLELHFYGASGECAAQFEPYAPLVGSKIFRHGMVPQQQAVAAMRDASVLVNIGNDTAYQLPSKVVEYAAMAKPIVNFVASDDDSSKLFLADFDGTLSVATRSASGDDVLRDMIQFLECLPEIDADSRRHQIAAYKPGRIAAQYLALKECGHVPAL